jgi:large subunit ribosomal protein L25
VAESLAVDVRETSGKGVARKLRAQGRVPGVLYGHGVDPVSLVFDPDALESLLRKSDAGLNTLFDLDGAAGVAGKTVLVKDMQRHPAHGYLMHADLYAIDVTERISVSVPIHLIGIPHGVSMGGGLLDHSLRELELDCLPRSIPDSVDVDVSALELGDSVHVSDLALPDGVELRTDAGQSVASVVAPKVEEEPVADEVAEGEEAPEDASADAEGADSKEEESKSDD